MKSAIALTAGFAILVFAAPNLVAETTLRGATNGMNGQPIPGVQVSAIEGANAVGSESNGMFLLTFKYKEPGDFVQLVVQKPGMAIVNELELKVTLPKPAVAAPLILRLCRLEDLQDMKRRYYALDGVNRVTEAEYDRLRIELDRMKKVAADEKLAREKTDEAFKGTAPIYRSNEAIALNRVGTIYRSQNRAEEARKAYEEALQISRNLADLDSAKYLPDVVDTLNNLGTLLLEQGLLEKAGTVLDEALAKSRHLAQQNPTYLPTVAMTLDNRAALFGKQNRREEERAALEEALGLYRDLAQRTSPIYWLRAAEALIKIGGIKLVNNPVEARKAFNEALVIYQNIPRNEPEQYRNEIESTIDLVRDSSNGMLALYNKLAEANSNTYLVTVAATQRQLRTFLWKENRIEEASRTFDEELKAYRDLARQNPETYGPQVAATLYDLGTFLREQQQTEEALKAFETALQAYREAAERDPGKHLPNVASTLYDLSAFLRELQRTEEARKVFDDALKTYRELAQLGLDLPNVAARLYALGTSLRDQNRMEEARKTFEEAAEAYKKLLSSFLAPSREHQLKIAKILTDLGMINRDLHRRDDTRKAFGEALAIYKTLDPKAKYYSREVESIRLLLDEPSNVPKP